MPLNNVLTGKFGAKFYRRRRRRRSDDRRGTGDDIYTVDNVGDIVTEFANGGKRQGDSKRLLYSPRHR